MKVYNWDNFTCCSGTYSQNMADYYNLAYYKDAGSLYVNLYVPSEVTWQRPGGNVVVEQETLYPEAETSVLTLRPAEPSAFALKLRVPSWTRGMSVKVNGAAANVECRPGTWATLERRLLADNVPACREFHQKYYDARGYVQCALRWGANDGPDDAFENFNRWPELHALGADDEILRIYL